MLHPNHVAYQHKASMKKWSSVDNTDRTTDGQTLVALLKDIKNYLFIFTAICHNIANYREVESEFT